MEQQRKPCNQEARFIREPFPTALRPPGSGMTSQCFSAKACRPWCTWQRMNLECQVAYRQENTGGYMADGYARITGKVGVVTAQNGPAAALLVAPLAEALKASVPLIALVQDVSREQIDRDAFQELNHESMFRP